MKTISAFGRLLRPSERPATLLLLALLACDSGAPADLPPPAPRPPVVNARAVAVGALRAYLARPAPEAASGARTLLIAGGELNEHDREQARARAERGAVVQLLAASADEGTGRAYLEGLEGQGAISRECLDPASACVNQSP